MRRVHEIQTPYIDEEGNLTYPDECEEEIKDDQSVENIGKDIMTEIGRVLAR